MTVREFLGTLTVATIVKAKTHDDKNLLEAAHTSDTAGTRRRSRHG